LFPVLETTPVLKLLSFFIIEYINFPSTLYLSAYLLIAESIALFPLDFATPVDYIIISNEILALRH